MSFRPFIIVALCLSLLSAGGPALAGPRMAEAMTFDAVASAAASAGASMVAAVKPCHEDLSPAGEMLDDDSPVHAFPSAPADCCGHCDCGCVPVSAFALTAFRLTDPLEPASVRAVGKQITSIAEPPLLRPPIA